MAGLLLKVGIFVVVSLAITFQLFLKDPVWLAFSIGKHIQPLSDFPYNCRRIEDPRLEACEDMWLSEETRVLYLACSDSLSRSQWLPNNHNFNLTGRSERDAIIALQIDSPKGESFEYRALRTPDFAGTAGDGLLHLAGFTGVDVREEGEDRVELLLVNARPSLDLVTGMPLHDQTVSGGNSTIEVFEVRSAAAEEMTHLHTLADALVITPNNVAADRGTRNFYTTNDHGSYKVGFKSQLGVLLGSGDVVFCSIGKGCKRVSSGHKFPNGLAQYGGFVYVPSSIVGGVQVFRILEDNELEKIEDIAIDYSLDNLSVDGNGDLYVAAFPQPLKIFEAFLDPFNAKTPSTVLRIWMGEDGRHQWEKVLEDAEGTTLPGATTALHDAKTGRLFLSGVVSPFITVCEPRA